MLKKKEKFWKSLHWNNNLDESDTGNFNEKFSKFTNEDKEKLYDHVYNYCLEAFLELENKEGHQILKELKHK